MKIESSKTNQDKKADQRVNKSENAFRSISNGGRSSNAPAPSAGAFEKIMTETRRQSVKDDPASSKTENGPEAKESSEVKKEGDMEVVGKENLRERDGKKEGGGDGGGADENYSMPGAFALFANGKVSAENSVPAARSILHIADLERIVSTLRSIESKNSQQILIALKNSVLEGLQIRLSVEENGKLKAEFLALNEKIKEHLKARRSELFEILKSRGVKLQELEIGTFSQKDTGPNPPEKPDRAAGII